MNDRKQTSKFVLRGAEMMLVIDLGVWALPFGLTGKAGDCEWIFSIGPFHFARLQND